MMRFLKSTLFPNRSPILKNKSDLHESEVLSLKKRIELLEEQNKKSVETIQELSTCVRSISFVLTDIATEIAMISTHSSSIDSHEDDMFNTYINNPDDDDGYLN